MPIRIKHEKHILNKLSRAPNYVNGLTIEEDAHKRKWLIHRNNRKNMITDILYYTIEALQKGTPVCLQGASNGLTDIRKELAHYTAKDIPLLEDELQRNIGNLSPVARMLYALDTMLIKERKMNNKVFYNKLFWAGVSFMKEPYVIDIMADLKEDDKLLIPNESYTVSYAFDALLSWFCRGDKFKTILQELLHHITLMTVGTNTITELYDLERALASRNKYALALDKSTSYKRKSIILPFIPGLRTRIKNDVRAIQEQNTRTMRFLQWNQQ